MTVATGVGGTTVVGATLGAGFLESGSVSPQSLGSAGQLATEAARTLPFTGANHLVLLFVLGLLALLTGALMVGLARRHGTEFAPPPTV